MDIGMFLKEKREEMKISRKKIAEKLHISPEALRDIEHGKTRLSLENFLIICQELNISPMQLIKKSNEHYILLNDKDIIAINPGSMTYPRQEGRKPSFIIMELDKEGNAHFTINYME